MFIFNTFFFFEKIQKKLSFVYFVLAFAARKFVKFYFVSLATPGHLLKKFFSGGGGIGGPFTNYTYDTNRSGENVIENIHTMYDTLCDRLKIRFHNGNAEREADSENGRRYFYFL